MTPVHEQDPLMTDRTLEVPGPSHPCSVTVLWIDGSTRVPGTLADSVPEQSPQLFGALDEWPWAAFDPSLNQCALKG